MRLDLQPRLALVLVLAFGVIAVALASQYLGGLTPCALCVKQRAPYYLAVPLLALAYWYAPRAALAAQGLLHTVGVVFLISSGLGIYHAGIEYGFWPGPASCGGGEAFSGDTQNLLKALQSAAIVRCDTPAWKLFGISLAGYNALASGLLAALALGPNPARTDNRTDNRTDK